MSGVIEDRLETKQIIFTNLSGDIDTFYLSLVSKVK